MSKKRGREREGSAKRFRQSTLDAHFSPGSKNIRAVEEEELPLEEMSLQMSAEDKADLQRRRDMIADAAERRKKAHSPWTTPPHNQEDSQPERSCTPEEAHGPGIRDAASKTSSKTDDLAVSPSASGNLAWKRTHGSDTAEAVERTHGRMRLRENMFETGTEDAEMHDRHNRNIPSTSREGCPVSPVNAEGGFDDGDESREGFEERDAWQNVEMSPTLEYDGSQPLFTDSEHSVEEPTTAKRSKEEEEEEETYWKGCPISDLNRAPGCLPPLPELRPSTDHSVLIQPNSKGVVPPQPSPEEYDDRWDSEHVRMPCSPDNLYPVENQEGLKKVQSRWELIEATLLSGIKNSLDLEEAILTYNARYSQRWNFRALHVLFTEVLDVEETTLFFDKILPAMVQLALRLPKLCTQAVPLLRRQRTHSITLSQQQVASLLANAFFCTFPRRNAQQKKSEYSRFPDINFNRLFEMGQGYKNHRKIEKLKCILNYFRRVAEKVPTGTITISRRALSDLPRWERGKATLTQLYIAAAGTIEKEGHGMLQMDFANKYIGGGALGFGCVQEEIRFMICPELIVTRLITEVLDENECIVVKGVEQFNNYSGYGNSFKWRGNFQDSAPVDSWGRRETEIVAVDALVIRRYEDQFRPDLLRRELNKAYCGFCGDNAAPEHLPAVATGNWGCGAFGGDKRTKGLLQLMAAAMAGRDVAYFSFGDKELCDDMAAMHEFLCSQAVTVGDLWGVFQRYRKDVLRRSAGTAKPKIFHYLYQLYTMCDSDTDEFDPDQPKDDSVVRLRGHSPSPDYQAETP
ncbi:poly(ADP-ribose) glycohydrolase-like [Diadema antillarum]|uniref:poly(ADP-ribose) glycohydrolase-like n=1 Tax=Diadema antillarum TaxID=105358 RepID=UPI003A8A70A7